MDKTRRGFIITIILVSIIQLIGIECKNTTPEPSTPQELFEAYYQTLDSELWNKQMPRSPETDLCIELYNSKKYNEAIDKMSKLAETTPQKDQWVLRLYWGICHLALDETIEAYTLFNQIDPNSKVGTIAMWYKALAFLKVNKLEQAKASLRVVQRKKGIYKDKATVILEILNKK